MNLFALLDQAAARHGDRGAVYHGEHQVHTWSSLRERALRLAGSIHSLGDAMRAAEQLDGLAKQESSASASERDAAERERLLQQLGADPAARTQPPHVRSQLAALEKEQKTRATRIGRDVIDRSLVDLMSIYRDALVQQTGSPVELINQDHREQVDRLTSRPAESLLGAMDAIGTARERIAANVPPLLALEAMMIALRTERD